MIPCNAQCVFCYLRGEPSHLGTRPTPVSLEAIREAAPRSDFTSFLLQPSTEPFLDPHLLEKLAAYRQGSNREIVLGTNADLLDDRVMAGLAAHRGVTLSVSLHTVDPARRASLMGSPRAGEGIAAVKRLRGHGVAFGGNVVAWPSLQEQEIRDCADFLFEHGASQVSLLLPSYTRYAMPDEDTRRQVARRWDEVRALYADLRGPNRLVTASPMAAVRDSCEPVVEHVTVAAGDAEPGAPLHRGDVVLEVAGEAVLTGSDFVARRAALDGAAGGGPSAVVVRRGGQRLVLTYPSQDTLRRALDRAVVYEDLASTDLRCVEALVEARRGRAGALFVSRLIHKYFDQLLPRFPALAEAVIRGDLVPTETTNTYYGGNVVLGDLTFVSDYVFQLEAMMRRQRLSYAIIPASFLDAQGLDRMGVPLGAVAQLTGVEPVPLSCRRIIV